MNLELHDFKEMLRCILGIPEVGRDPARGLCSAREVPYQGWAWLGQKIPPARNKINWQREGF